MCKVKLDKEDVKQIKILCASSQMKDAEIAKIYGVSRKHINSIRNGKRWSENYGKEKDTIKEELERYFKN